jgi:hypothetical protein
MNDQELAKSIEALGIGRPTEYITPQGDDGWWEELNDYDFVRDWRVAGALMEKMTRVCEWYEMAGLWKVRIDDSISVRNESLPRAICEAIVRESLERGKYL